MRRQKMLIATAALVGCSTAPGSGWSRAPDLSVYGSAHSYARIAWEQEVFCQGAERAHASARFEREFGARDAAVRAALVERHGEAAIARAGRHFVQRVPCGDVPDPQWRARYDRLLRLLETRLGLS